MSPSYNKCLLSQPQNLEAHTCGKEIQEGKELEMKRSSQIFHGPMSLQGGPEQPKKKKEVNSGLLKCETDL